MLADPLQKLQKVTETEVLYDRIIKIPKEKQRLPLPNKGATKKVVMQLIHHLIDIHFMVIYKVTTALRTTKLLFTNKFQQKFILIKRWNDF